MGKLFYRKKMEHKYMLDRTGMYKFQPFTNMFKISTSVKILLLFIRTNDNYEVLFL